MKNKLAIVLSGGGMTCSYSAGFLSALVYEHGFKDPDIIIAGSGSSGAAAYYTAGQYASLTNVWTKRLSSKKFINILRIKRIIDIDYLIDEVFKVQEPLKIEKVLQSKIKLLIPATNTETGELEYFSNDGSVDIYEAMRASKAMPILFGKKINIKGQTYYDTALSSSTKLHIRKALELGATHIIVVTNNRPGLFTKVVYGFWVNCQSSKFKKNYYRIEKYMKEGIETKNVKLIWLKPKIVLPVKALTSDNNALIKTVEYGIEDCKNCKDLTIFLNDYKKLASLK